MHRNKMLIASAVILVGVVATFFGINSTHTPTTPPDSVHLTQTPPATSAITNIPDGTLDTSNWHKYRSEYGGFSVRAPKKMSSMGCPGHGCSPTIEGEQFYFVLVNLPTADASLPIIGLKIEILKKESNSTLDTWLQDYVASGRDNLSDIQKTSVNGYPALQFDQSRLSPGEKGLVLKDFAFLSGKDYSYSTIASISSPSRFLVVDLGNQYAFVYHTMSLNKKELLKSVYFAPESTTYTRAISSIPDNKTLSKIYTAILNSFQAFTPTKL